MTISTVSTVMGRVKTASIKSPIAVFLERTPQGKKALNAVFGDTVHTKGRIADDDRSLVGVFHQESNMTSTRAILHKATR